MTEPPTPLSPAPNGDPASALDRARALIEPQVRLLGRLAEIGLEVAEAIERQVKGEAPISEKSAPVSKGDPSLAFARVSRAVRLTLALQSKLIEALAALEAGPAIGAPGDRPDPDYILKARVERIVERTAEAEHDGDEGAVDRLVAEAGDRLDDIDLYGDLLDRPMSEIVARICRDIGLPLDWTRLAREAWARTEMQAGKVGAPLATLLDDLNARPPPVADFNGPDLEEAGPRRSARLAVTARRGRRADRAKAPGAPPGPTHYLVSWSAESPASGSDNAPARGSA